MLDIAVTTPVKQRVKKAERFYVYTLAYPDGTVFYCGKGTGSRIFHHEKYAREGEQSKKSDIIRKVWADDGCVQKNILYETTVERDALIYEWALINMVFDAENLANVRVAEEVDSPPPVSNLQDIPEQPFLTLQELREWAVLTQVELAEKVGISVTIISNWETGSKRPRASNIRKLAVALNVPSQHIIAAIQATFTN